MAQSLRVALAEKDPVKINAALNQLAEKQDKLGAVAVTWTTLQTFNGGWQSTLTDPTLQVPFPGFTGHTVTPDFYVANNATVTWNTTTNRGTAIAAHAIVPSTATGANNGEVGAFYAGTLNQHAGWDPYGALFTIYNDDNVGTSAGGQAGWFIVRGTKASSQVRGIHITSEISAGQHAVAAVLVDDLGTSNQEFSSGIQILSAKDHGFIVGTQFGSGSQTIPTYPFAFYATPSVLTYYVDSSGNVSATDVYTNDATYFIRTKATLTNGSAAATATLTNAPTAGNPTKWIAIDDNGTKRQIPAW